MSSRTDIKEADVLAIIQERAPITAIDVTRELIDRGQCVNQHAIGAVDVVRRAIEVLVREGKVSVVKRRTVRAGLSKQKVYGPADAAA